jgi:GNAT superfamily N-acetyltransferase
LLAGRSAACRNDKNCERKSEHDYEGSAGFHDESEEDRITGGIIVTKHPWLYKREQEITVICGFMDTRTVALTRDSIQEREALLERAREEWGGTLRSHSGARYAWDGIADFDEDLLVLESPDGKLLGALSFCTRYGDEKNIYVSRIGVIPKRRGYGKRLMQAVSRIAAARGQGIVALPTEEGRLLFRGIGMRTRPGGDPHQLEYAFTPDEAKAFVERPLESPVP